MNQSDKKQDHVFQPSSINRNQVYSNFLKYILKGENLRVIFYLQTRVQNTIHRECSVEF
ncbi:hypothetical protein LEP1GSC016_4211 [Leptospira borgpetersenii serovar Hardjo-bovis str. Sponselee]|uniref:Uncharacterized protein n=5 Tax=Leptospira borgpetersenii TaxID=174 RepID=M3H4S7_LEPBO|nr:hypothetical protein LEP1GSC128_1736 [Leptospira borgpetersenii str. 200801926]EKQ92578.1 hypothetical protein LEP1GSC101_2621 [Leptospira borgpetersenii str. UI 09149]EMG02079.1 hypothetical protein LEP1GSC123_0081 [Leptospira borgpetersenii str. 200701203]EMJ78181.1 hypothetical protein LEP1GSC016_4211 [Leptospira borgpetersenii serovar Hardjo-bovis str. Sponselee]EMK10512.1 hypothetical protein LEP1GSC066_0404 [Leptospira sp. serovar Kenya str. Sh9]EMN18360.1 hypothetical protein LEP1GSC